MMKMLTRPRWQEWWLEWGWFEDIECEELLEKRRPPNSNKLSTHLRPLRSSSSQSAPSSWMMIIIPSFCWQLFHNRHLNQWPYTSFSLNSIDNVLPIPCKKFKQSEGLPQLEVDDHHVDEVNGDKERCPLVLPQTLRNFLLLHSCRDQRGHGVVGILDCHQALRKCDSSKQYKNMYKNCGSQHVI